MSLQTDALAALESIKAAQINPQQFGKATAPLSDSLAGQATAGTNSMGPATTGVTSGLVFYDLEIGAKFLYPVLTPLRNAIPRQSGKGGLQANWRAVTSVNVNNVAVGIPAGTRNAVQAMTTQNYTASYVGIGMETNVDFETQYAAQNFDDVRAIAAKTGLEALMLGEEAMILGGQSSYPLSQCTQPVVSQVSTGGLGWSAVSTSVVVMPLNLAAYLAWAVNMTAPPTLSAGSYTVTTADSNTFTQVMGCGKKSVNATFTPSATSTVSATTSVVNNAVAYAWFWGTAGSEILGAITTINSVQMTGPATGTMSAAGFSTSVDASASSLSFDGLLTIANNPNFAYPLQDVGGLNSSGQISFAQPTGVAGVGQPLTADGAGGIIEIDRILKSFWDYFRLSPDTAWVSSQEALNISRKILQAGSNSAQRFVFETSQDMIGGGVMVRTYLNRFSMNGGNVVNIRIHPNMPAGTILFTTSALPYPLSGVGNLMQIRCRQDYYQIEWPLRSRRYEYGVYADETLQHYFPASMATISNIGNG
jgi:hypothetical protein